MLMLAGALTAGAQKLRWDREKYPDLPSPEPTNIDMRAYRQMKERIRQQEAEGHRRPDHLNNALNPAFPPIINQSGGSCGAASSIYYQFTNQINTARFVAADSDERRYATHFPWMLNTNGPGGTGYDRLGRDVGIASCAVYGGTTYSRIYGSSGQDDQDDDCGWMQGYDSWYATMHNRILCGNSFAFNCGTEEGRELVKNYLWNRCGDESYASGGICGIGVAAGPFEGNIPKTTANDAAGVTGMKYVTDWGETYNHAMTIVGYDDRIEFDLDHNGVIGEACNADGDNEVGAWIIANSWGDGWCDKGFIYCPYERSNSVKGWAKTSSFTPGYYDIIRDYRPLRTIKVRMDYSHRSEIALHVGVAQDLSAEKPERATALTHFEYCGDGDRGTKKPAPAVPMLGRWADGQLHTEPMELGYDMTTLTEGLDFTRPIKYFFWVERRSWAEGSGKIYYVSIMDYAMDRDGVEIPFELGGTVDVASAGKNDMLTAIVSNDIVPEPRNLALIDGRLTWEAPPTNAYMPKAYRIYRDGTLLTTVTAETLAATVSADGCYSVSAVYAAGDSDIESRQSASVATTATPDAEGHNTIASLQPGTKLVIPNLIERTTEEFTMEFWIRTRATSTGDNYGFRIKADTTVFLFKVTRGNIIELGQDGGSYTRTTATIRPNDFHHVAIVCKGIETRLYIDGKNKLTWENNYNHRGIKGPARLVIGETEGTSKNYKKVYDSPWDAYLDELRFWTYARTEEQVKASYCNGIANAQQCEGLQHYYKMDTRGTDAEGRPQYLVDCCGNCDAEIIRPDLFATQTALLGDEMNPLSADAKADFDCAATTVVGQPFVITDRSSLNTAFRTWSFTGTTQPTLAGTVNPVIIFTEAGEQTITLQTTSLYGGTAEKSVTVNVAAVTPPAVDFRLPDGEIRAGDHVTFINASTPVAGTTFVWDIEGADVPQVGNVNAAATFAASGTYTVRLTATNAAGTASAEKQVAVIAVAPQVAFNIRNNVVVKGQNIDLLDATRFTPDTWTWELSSNLDIYRYTQQNTSIIIDEPGIYDVTLTASNAQGSDQLTRRKAVVVCNADGKTGLHMDGTDDLVEAASPFGDQQAKSCTIGWWMLPGRITDIGQRIGDTAATLLISVKPDGTLCLSIGGNTFTTPAGTVITDEWHHYAFSFRGGKVTFYRDGIKIHTQTISRASAIPVMERFAIGGTEMPFNGIIDELRVWNRLVAEKEILGLANEPVANPADENSLILYYDFNQNGGDVKDRSASGLDGKRTNFGPDGDAWDTSLGIFCLNPRGTAIDVTSTYLKNYVHPFKTGAGTVNPANSQRYLKLLMNNTSSPWQQLNTVKKGSILTEWHVDTEKNNYLTLEDTYSGFESDIKDLMIFQTVDLPAGAYTFTADRDGDDYYYNWLPEGTYVAATAGDRLPLTADLESDALAWSPLGDNPSVTFVLNEPTQVSLGLIANMHDKRCVAVGRFILHHKQLIYGQGTEPTAVSAPMLTSEATLQAAGGIGCISIRVMKPQRVVVTDLTGKLVFADWLDVDARIPARRGIYIVNKQKILVR